MKKTLKTNHDGSSNYFVSYIGLGKKGKTKTVILHRALAETFIENLHEYKYVAFKDGNYENLYVDNLVWNDTPKLRNIDEQILRRKEANVINVSNRRRHLKEMAVDYKGGKCIICGYSKYLGALEFHHLDPESKDFAISTTGTTKSWTRIKHELDKCICVCANCHREIHGNLINIEEYSSNGKLAQ